MSEDQSNNVVATYKYDANGRRVEKAVSGGVTERYVYSGLETVAVYDGSNARQREFVFGQGIDEVLMMEQADVLDFDADSNTSELTRSFYDRNALGSVMEITDMNQVTVESLRYTPYGQVTITRGGSTQSSDPLGQHWAYTGRWQDEETGLLYYRARYYDPQRGRFLQRDPLGLDVDPSLYEYSKSRPTVLTDPYGLTGDLPCAPCGDYPGSRREPFLERWLGKSFDSVPPFTPGSRTSPTEGSSSCTCFCTIRCKVEVQHTPFGGPMFVVGTAHWSYVGEVANEEACKSTCSKDAGDDASTIQLGVNAAFITQPHATVALIPIFFQGTTLVAFITAEKGGVVSCTGEGTCGGKK